MARGRNTALRSLTERKYSRRSPHGSTARYSVYDRRESMARWDLRFSLVVAASLTVLVGLVADLALDAGRPYPGFFAAPDFRLFPAEPDARAAGLRQGDRLVAVDGASPLTLAARVRAAAGPIRYEVERAGRRLSVELAPRPLRWARLIDRFGIYVLVSAIMLGVGALVYVQNPAAAPNRRFLLYMCLWAVSNVAVPAAVLGARTSAATVVGLVAPLLSIHGWVFFLTYPANPARERWLERHRAIPRLYRLALALGVVGALAYVLIVWRAPALLVDGWIYPASAAVLSLLSALSFPIKVGALLDTKRRAASPLIDQHHRAPAGHRDGARRVALPDALAAPAALRERGGPAGGLGLDAALPGGHWLRHRALPALRRHRGHPALGHLHRARRPDHRSVRAAAGGSQRAAGPGRPHPFAVVLGRLHVPGGAPLQPAAGAGAARGGPDVLPRAPRLGAGHAHAGQLDVEPARPGGDHPPPHHHHRVRHARADGPPARGRPAARRARRPRDRAGRALPLPGCRRSALRGGGRRRARGLPGPRRGGGGAAALPGP